MSPTEKKVNPSIPVTKGQPDGGRPGQTGPSGGREKRRGQAPPVKPGEVKKGDPGASGQPEQQPATTVTPAAVEQKKPEKGLIARGVEKIKALFSRRKEKKVGADKDTVKQLEKQLKEKDELIAKMDQGRQEAEKKHAQDIADIKKQLEKLIRQFEELADKQDAVAKAIDGGSGKPAADAALKDGGTVDSSTEGSVVESEEEKLTRQREEEAARLALEHEKNMSDATGRVGDNGEGVDNIQYWGTDRQPSAQEAATLLSGKPEQPKKNEDRQEEPPRAWTPDFTGAGWQDDDSGDFYDEKFHPGNKVEEKPVSKPEEIGEGKPVEVQLTDEGGKEGKGKAEKRKSSLPERQLEGLTAEQLTQVERIRKIAEGMNSEERARIKAELQHDLESRAMEYADWFPRSGEGKDAKYNMTRLVVDAWNRADGRDNFADAEQLKRAIVYGEAAKEIQEERVEKQMEALSAAYTEYFAPGGSKPASIQELEGVGSDRVAEVGAAYGKYMGPESDAWETVADTARRIVDGWNVSQGKDWFADDAMVKNALLQAMRTVNSSRR